MMTRLLTFLMVLFAGLSVMAQSESIDSRLFERYSDQQLADMQDNAPSRLAFWTYYLDHSYSILDIPAEKSEALSSMETLDIPSREFHGFSMLLDEFQKQGATFRFKGEDKMLIIKPMEQFITEFNAYYKSMTK